MTLKTYLVGVPEEFKDMLTRAFTYREYCKNNPAKEMMMQIHRNGEFVENVDIKSLDQLKGTIIRARNAIQDHKRGGSIILTTCDNGFLNNPFAIVDIW